MEAFKIRNGMIYRVEVVFTYVPYFMHSPYASPAAASVPAAVPRPAAPSGHCDRACLFAAANNYMDALVAREPARVPWAPSGALHREQCGDDDW